MERVVNPKTIALIGASSNPDKVGGILIDKTASFTGDVVYVNPHYQTINNKSCYPSVLAYPGSIDLAFIAVPHPLVLQAVKDCAKKHIPGVVIITSGFSEVGNHKEEQELVRLAQKSGMRIFGPNCFGICNPRIGLDATFAKATPKKGSIAFISQSGALWSYIADFANKDIGFSSFVSLGNMSDVEFTDCIDYFAKDKHTKTIVLYIEKLKHGKEFIELCKKCKKPIYAVKAGSSDVGSKAAFSHTGSLATDYAVYKGALAQAGVTLCNTLEEAFEKASRKRFSYTEHILDKNHIGKRAFIITNAGGAGALAADYLSQAGFEVMQSPGIKNPLDVLGTATSQEYIAALESVRSLDYDFIVLIATPQSMTDMDSISWLILENNMKYPKKIVPMLLGKQSVSTGCNLLSSNGIHCFSSLESFKRSLK